MRKRTRGRELALKFLYRSDLTSDETDEAFADFSIDQETLDEVREFAGELVRGVIADREELIALIEGSAHNWTWTRMPVVDRTLLLIGAFELTRREDVPAVVTINEVVELAKKYSTASSGAFVNGVLDTIERGRNVGTREE